MGKLDSVASLTGRPKVIDQEASLPPSTLSTELLQFHPMQRITYNVLAALIASNVYTSDFEDIDYFLHPRNVAAYKQVVKNLHLACFWYSAQDMGVAECIKRSRVHLADNETLTEEGKVGLAEAISHLERALETPGWQEWMTNGISIPFEVDQSFPLSLRQAWSDSMDDNPDAIDAHSLQVLRDANANGTELHDLHIAGWDNRATKWPGFLEEMEKAEKRIEINEKRAVGEGRQVATPTKKTSQRGPAKSSRKTGQAAAANAPTVAPRVSPRKGQSSTLMKSTKEAIDNQLDKAVRNSMKQPLPRFDLPRPLPIVVHTKSRSAKVNFVVDSIRSAAPTDKFVVFGDFYELVHVQEVLYLFDIKL